MKVGVYPGKFLPPHRGHLTGILRAHSLCDQLFVAISENRTSDGILCSQDHLPYITGELRKRWLSHELGGLDIQIVLIDETGIPDFPNGWAEYANLVRTAIGKPIDVIFGGEPSYQAGHDLHFPGVEYRILDPNRTKWPISASAIRRQPYTHWEYILGTARPFFAKRVLITGPESCGKSTLTKKLAKVFYTSWSEEAGRAFQENELDGDGSLFALEDFNRIAELQHQQDLEALSRASKVCFFDTDAVVTHFFSEFFVGEVADRIVSFVNPKKYDLVIALKPSVPWVDDGTRDTADQAVRDRNYNRLIELYSHYGFDVQKFLVVDSPNYFERLEQSIVAVEKLLVEPKMEEKIV